VEEDTYSNAINKMAKPLTSEFFLWAPLMRNLGVRSNTSLFPEETHSPPLRTLGTS
jgi:hypothetical protein